MKGKKMHRVLLCAFCLVLVIAITSAINPVDEVDESELEEVSRPIRGSQVAASSSGNTRKRGRQRSRHRNRETSEDNSSSDGGRVLIAVQRRKLPSNRATRAPLFEASPEDPFLELGQVGPTAESEYGHSHSPPTRDPYYSPSKFERERKRQRKLARARENSANNFEKEEPVSAELSKREKNYAFAYAVGDEDEDFSHKQAKDGPITIGEYRITLPDGRTQVVRYTAGGKHGYKADVTYEAPSSVKQHHSPVVHQQNHVQHQQNHQKHQLQQHQQYHASVHPTHHLSGTPVPSINSNRVYKSRPLKNIALHTNEDIEYSPPSSSNDEDEVEYHIPAAPQPTLKIRLKGGGDVPGPLPTVADFLNGVSTTPTPRPNSIYDKISPYRNGGSKYAGSDELAYAHEHSPRAGPVRAKERKNKAVPTQLADVHPTYATVYDAPVASPTPRNVPRKNKVNPTKKYKSYYVNGAAAHLQPQTHHVVANDHYTRPLKNFQYLQETPVTHNHNGHYNTGGIIVAKPVKQPAQTILSINNHLKAEPHVSYAPQTIIASKPRKLKKSKHGIHQPLGQYLQTPVTGTAHSPIQSHHQVNGYHQTAGPAPFQYYNSFHEPHHHGYGLTSPKPTTSVRHSESPFPNAYPVTAFPIPTGVSGGGGSALINNRLPSAPSQSGHVYLETPASGERPNRQKIKEALSRLPINDLPTPKTTIHPYEVGSADYGKSVAYGNPKGRGIGYSPFPSGLADGLDSFDHLDPTNSLFSSVSSPSAPTTGLTGGSPTGGSYYPDVADQFNFLDGFDNFDIEQASVREIRQPRPTKSGRKSSNSNNNNQVSINNNSHFSSRRLQRRPVNRQGVPARSSEETTRTPTTPTTRHRRRQSTSSPPRATSAESTTSRNRGRKRRLRTQQQPDSITVEPRRPRPSPTSTSRSSNHNRRN